MLTRAAVVRYLWGEKDKPLDTLDYRNAMSGEGPRAYDWSDKPHRLVFDLCAEIERLRGLKYDPDSHQLSQFPRQP